MSGSVRICIIHPMDPEAALADGVQTCIKDFIKYAPRDFKIEWIGITSGSARMSLREWRILRAGSKDFAFLPMLYEKSPERRRVIPLSLRFLFALKNSRADFSDRLLFFNRMEPALLFAKAPNPKILIVHNDVEEQMRGGKSEVLWSRFPWLYFRLEKKVLGFMDRVYAVNRRTAEFYCARYPSEKDKFYFLPVWVDLAVFSRPKGARFILRARLNLTHSFLPAEKKWILFVGRLQQQKAPLRILDAFFEYRKKDPEAALIILGDGNARAAMERHVEKLRLSGQVFFLGSRGQEEVIDFYRASDVLLLASNFEGMPRCVLEALACGLPVVATAVGEIKRVVKDGISGEVVEDPSPHAISTALDKVLSSPDLYAKPDCLQAVAPYSPQDVLRPVYEHMELLYRRRCSQKEHT